MGSVGRTESRPLKRVSSDECTFRYISHHSLDSQTKSVVVNISSTEETRHADDWFSTAESKRYG